ncbi:proline/glycine betaine ABC transporter permease [bacterium]|nr:proline/glycine betaine ABC transporter permease [bacterium]
MIDLDIGGVVEVIIDWLTNNFGGLFDAISAVLTSVVGGLEWVLTSIPVLVVIALFVALAWWMVGRGVAVFTLIGLLLIDAMGFWDDTMVTLALVLTSALVALVLGIPLGVLAARSKGVERVVRPILDTMQTMPAFVYLIPAVLFFSLGTVPGVVATVVFAMPPVVRLTNLGIRQVREDVVEAAHAFGATPRQVLIKVQLPLALPTILAGVNQTIMLALSMVVIAAMIGAGGLGQQVLKGITQLNVGLGFEAGFAIVILAIVLDRITQAMGAGRKTTHK